MKTNYLIIFLISILFFSSCEQESYLENAPLGDISVPTSMRYPNLSNIREFSAVSTGIPFINSNGRPVYYEILSARNENGSLDASYLQYVSIINPTEQVQSIPDGVDNTEVTIINTANAGSVEIAENDVFSNGDYYFTIKATIQEAGNELSATFDDVLHLKIGPDLVSAILYCPVTVNLIVGEGTATDAAEVPFGNPDIRFELVSPADKLQVDPVTGSFSLLPSYTVTEPEILEPVVNVISNISEEIVTFEAGFLTIIASNEPFTVDSEPIYFFYPSLAAVADDNGFSKVIIEQGSGVANNKVARSVSPPSPLAAPDRDAAGVSGNFLLRTNPVTNNPLTSVPHESWVVMDAQDLTPWSGCFETTLTYYLKHQSLEYLVDGRTPSDIEVYITGDYTGDVTTTSWTQINDILTCEINDSGDVFTGTPYPGDNTGPDPDGLKDPTKSYFNVWMKCELNLAPYLDQTTFTLAFKYATYFNETLFPGSTGRSGNFQLSDVNIKAKEL